MASNGGTRNSVPYKDLINGISADGGAAALQNRLTLLRKWATKQAGITIHSAICVVNGEATDGTRNAPILTYGPPQPVRGALDASSPDCATGGTGSSSEARCGAIDSPADRAIYDRSVGCQIRTVRDLKKDEVALSIPYSVIITPDLIAASDSGQAVLACCEKSLYPDKFWDSFGLTSKLENQQMEKIQQNSGTQLLVKILLERKRVETKVNNAEQMAQEMRNGMDLIAPNLAIRGTISQRAPFLAFLIQQRFSNEQDPPVASMGGLPHGTPKTFAPYTRTLPASVSVPICWKRNELALLAGCIPGMPALQKVAARTTQLANELIALLDAGLLNRFPSIFTPDMITWDRWVWAAAVYDSRVLPVSSLPAGARFDRDSPANVWESCGVLIPFFDMLNHYDKPNVQWDAPENRNPATMNDDLTNSDDDDNIASTNCMKLITQERLKKHSQIYRNYGPLSNEYFIMQYGFARMSNPFDRVKIAWALVDGVGGVPPPSGYDVACDVEGIPFSHLVFESSDAEVVKTWWTEDRIALLGKAMMNNDDTMNVLRKGKKIQFFAFNNGMIDSKLIAVAIATTLPPDRISKWDQQSSVMTQPLDGLILDHHCRTCVRMYLSFLLTKKLEKLLQNLDSCIKDHFNSVRLWTKPSSGGLNYVGGNDVTPVEGENSNAVIGWQSFFEGYAYTSTMEIEEHYYAMAPDSCVLTLYDGHVRSLHSSCEVMKTDDIFLDNMRQQLEELGCIIPSEETAVVVKSEIQEVDHVAITIASDIAPTDEPDTNIIDANDSKISPAEKVGNEHGNKRDRRQSKRGERPPAIKLHIGNLSYQTLPNQLFDFFTRLYGKDSVLECHIPTERETSNSRGFGFVTMPENFAKSALEPGRSHEMNGRILKVAESNSAGTNKGIRQGSWAPVVLSSDRCSRCGYRPRWCTCNPGIAPMNMGMGPPPDSFYGPGPFMSMMPPPGMRNNNFDDHRRREGYGWGPMPDGCGNKRRSNSHSPSHHIRGRERGYHSRSRSRSYDKRRSRGPRSRSRSHSRSKDRRRDRDRHRRDSRDRHYRESSSSRARDGSPSQRTNDEGVSFPPQAKSRSRSPVDSDSLDHPPSSSNRREGKDPGGKSGRSRSKDRGSHKRKRSKGSRRGKEKRRGSRSRSR